MKTKKLTSIDKLIKKMQSQDKIHGNTKIRNFITGEKDRTMSQWRRAAKESADRLMKAFPVSDGL